MFRQIVAVVTLAALTLWTIGCSKVVTIPAEKATQEKKLQGGEGLRIEATSLQLSDGAVVEFDSTAAAYSSVRKSFSGRTSDGQELEVPSSLVERVSIRLVSGCDVQQQEVADMAKFKDYQKMRIQGRPLSVGLQPVESVTLKNGDKVKLGPSGLMYNCLHKNWIGYAKDGRRIILNQDDIQDYDYRVPQPGLTILLILGVAVALLFATLGIAIAANGGFMASQ